MEKSLSGNFGGANSASNGMLAASIGADSANPGWSDSALNLFIQYAEKVGDQAFMTEDVRDWAENEKGLASPPDPRAWGGVARRAAVCGVVRRAGWAPSKPSQSHGSPKSVWVTSRGRTH